MNCPITIHADYRNGMYYAVVSDNGRWLLNRGPYLEPTAAMETGREWAREYALAILREIGPEMPYSVPEEGATCTDMADGLNATWRPCGGVDALCGAA